MQQIQPAAPLAPWMGGKRILAQRIIERIEAIPHKTYVEPFVGMGGVFLRRRFRPACEVANDINGEIINLFRCVQRHMPYLLDQMRFQITSRQQFEDLRNSNPDGLTDLERAVRFLYLQRLAFGGKVDGVLGVSSTRQSGFSVARLEPLLQAAHARLDSVIFERLPWQDVMRRYDGANTLFYLDPPYWGGETDYGKNIFSKGDFSEMADMIRASQGVVIMSINDTPEIRAIFEGLDIEERSLKYTVSAGGGTDAKELIISNRPDGSRLI